MRGFILVLCCAIIFFVLLFKHANASEYNLFFGDLHGHTNFSDGKGGYPAQYFAYCRDVAKLDFCAVTDHNIGQKNLDNTSKEANNFNSPTFVTFSGNEWSSARYGHKSCYNISRSCSASSSSCDTPSELYASVKSDGGLCHAAHPAESWAGQNETDWSFSEDEIERAGEIYNNESKMNDAWKNYGLRLGAVGVTDSHDGRPGSVGVTGCYATELTRKGILEALNARRCFAASHNRTHYPVNLSFKINGHWMGEELSLDYGTNLDFNVIVNANYNIDKIHIKKDGDIIATKSDCNSPNCEFHYSSKIYDSSYYYVFVSTTAKNIVWSSPIFIELKNLVPNPSFEGSTWQINANNTNFENWDISRNSQNGIIKTWVETTNTHSGNMAFHWRTEAPNPSNISLNFVSNISKKIPIDENKYLEAGLWSYVMEGYSGDDISINFYFVNGSSIRLWGRDKLGNWKTGQWARASYLWHPSSMGEGKGYIPKGAKYARINVYCNWHQSEIRERIDDDVFVKHYDHLPDWKERLEKNFSSVKLIADYNKLQGSTNVSYSIHESDSHDFYNVGSNQFLIDKMKNFNFSYMRFQYHYFESCKSWNEANHSCNNYDWARLDKLIEAIRNIGAEPIICVAGGDISSSSVRYWLPTGMTANYSGTGYPSDEDFGNYVADLVRHLNIENGYNIKYWEIWNEPAPCIKTSEFVHLFNNAQQRMHEVDSTIKITTDRINIPPLAADMLNNAEGVGFLSFHHYASGGTCMFPNNKTNLNNIFYPPNDQNGWLADETIMNSVDMVGSECSTCWYSYSPKKLSSLWKQKTGKDFEIIGTELNLNSAWRNGTDHRQQNVFGATWWAAKIKAYILDGSDVSLAYFNLKSLDSGSSKPMSKYGGFGFGMMNASYPYTNFAPAWTAYLFTRYVPKGSLIFSSRSSDSEAIDILALESRNSKKILLINRVDEIVNFSLLILGFAVQNATLHFLDNTTYIQRYEPQLDKTIIYKSSIGNITLPKDNVQNFTFNGYTVAILEMHEEYNTPYIKEMPIDLEIISATWGQNAFHIKADCSGEKFIKVYSANKPPNVKIGGKNAQYDDSLSMMQSWKYDYDNKIINIKFSC